MHLLLVTIGSILALLAVDEKKAEPTPLVHVYVHNANNNNSQAASSSTAAAIGPEFLPCSHLYDEKQLKMCMKRLSLEELQRTLLAMNSRDRKQYLKILNDTECKELRCEYQEKQWSELAAKDPEFTKEIDRNCRILAKNSKN